MSYSAGFAERIINPKMGLELVGYFPRMEESHCNYILDPLFVKVLVINDGKNQSIILSYDSLGFDALTVDTIKRSISTKTSLESKDILIVATHTHSAPSASSYVINEWEKHEEYVQYLVSQTLEALDEAIKNKKAAKFSFGLTKCNWNRYRGDDGRAVIVDNSVAVVRVDFPDEVVILFSYACHPAILNLSYVSADFVGYARNTIQEDNASRKKRISSIFLNGCCGNINPSDPYQNDKDLCNNSFTPQERIDNVKKMGKELGRSVNEIIPKMSLLEETSIVNKLLTVKELEKDIGKKTKSFVQVQLIKFASLSIIGISGEPFIETGCWIKEKYGTKCIPVGYANENVGYVPLKEYFDDPRGRYYEISGAAEIVYGIHIPENLEQTIRQCIEILLTG